jgi:hypothetical protein
MSSRAGVRRRVERGTTAIVVTAVFSTVVWQRWVRAVATAKKEKQPAEIPKGVTPGSTTVDDLERFAAFLEASRKEHRRQLDEALEHKRISRDRYEDGLIALRRVQPSWRHRVTEKVRDIALDHTLFALLFVSAGVSAEAAFTRALRDGASFVAVFFFCFPLTVAAALIVRVAIWGIGEEGDLLATLAAASFIILFAGVLQTFLPGHEHLVPRPVWCSNLDENECGWSYPAVVIVAYWRAFGPAVLIACVLIGVLTGLGTKYPGAARKSFAYVTRVRNV